jgi:hypothetical protein
MSGYGAVGQSDPAHGLGERDASFLPDFLSEFMEGSGDNDTTRREPREGRFLGNRIQIKVSPESWRFIAYVSFWLMCSFAILMTKVFVGPALAAGPPDGSTCPPFEPDGKGFDITTNSHLNRELGYNNVRTFLFNRPIRRRSRLFPQRTNSSLFLQICVNWDYTPSREFTAMLYPLFEYSLLLYICLDFTNSAISYKKGYVSARYWTIAKIFFPIQVVLCAWFRMIFVILAYVNVQGHTAGFLGLQTALAMVAITNVFYIVETKTTYGFLGGAKGTRIAALVYLYGDLVISAIKIYLTCHLVISGSYPLWTMSPSGVLGKNFGQVIDMIWMLFNAILPLFISYVRAKSEKALVFEIDLPLPDSLFVTDTTA